jgi:hypothetical protein
MNTWAKYLMQSRVANGFVYEVNCALSLVILSIYFSIKYLRTAKNNWYKAGFMLLVLSLLTAVGLVMTHEDHRMFNNHSYSLMALAVSAYAIIFYYRKLLHPVVEHITATRSFWFISGLFVYYSGSFFIFSTYTIFIRIMPDKNYSILWGIHNIICVIMCVFISKGFLCRPYQQMSS